MRIIVTPERHLFTDRARFACAIGRGGIRTHKREGDGATPVGIFQLRRAFFRSDKIEKPETGLPIRAIRETDGWCDAADHPLYNRPVTLPFAASHERMWRDDDLYDLVIEIGQNDAPPIAHMGSAVFIHVATADYKPTEGCVALAKADLISLISAWDNRTWIEIRAEN